MRELTLGDIASLLQAPSPAVLTTYRKDGSPFVSPVWYQWSDKALEVIIAKDDVKLRHLQRDPRCALIVFESVPPFRGIEATGKPQLTTERAREIRLEISSRYLGAHEVRSFIRGRPPGVVVRLPINDARMWDLGLSISM